MTEQQQDLFAARQARDEALDRVADNSGRYIDKAMRLIQAMDSTPRIGEEIRLEVEAEIGKPHHHNAWGAIIAQCTIKGILVKTGVWRQMTTKASHARHSPEYRVNHGV